VISFKRRERKSSEETGLITIESHRSVKDTIDRICGIVESRGLKVFARIDHAKNAEGVGLQLRPTELVIFGDPKVGTLVIQDKQSAGIDLPVKMLAWEDASGKVWLTYNSAEWIAERHGLSPQSDATIKAIADAMSRLSNVATM
jgi:uncharacterized protein (DUF302 family)